MMIKFLHAADIHLDSPLRGLERYEGAPLEEIRGASRRAFENLIELAIDEGVKFVLIAGDLFDGEWKDYNTGLYFVKCMSRLRKAGIAVFISLGNHDAASLITKALKLPDNVTVFSRHGSETIRLDDLAVAIHGRSYPSRNVFENLVVEFPPHDPHCFNIGMLHTSLNGRPDHEPYAPCSLTDLTATGYDYWALGHVHQQEVVAREPWVVFPGCLQGRHVRETGPKGAFLVTVDNGEVLEVEHRQVDVLRWQQSKVDLALCESMESVYDFVTSLLQEELQKAGGRNLALRLELVGCCPVHDEIMRRSPVLIEDFRSLAVDLGDIWLEKVLFHTTGQDISPGDSADSPIADLLVRLENMDFNRASLFEFVPELQKLQNKLPFLASDDFPFDKGAGQEDDLRQDVRQVLLANLSGVEVES